MFMLSMLQALLTQALVPRHLHTAVLFTPAGELISFAVEPGRSKEEIRILVGITSEVWQETREQGYGMVESDLGRIIVLPVDEVNTNQEQAFSQAHQPFLLLALNATDAVEWEELDNKGRVIAQRVSEPLSKFRELLVSPRSVPSTAPTSPAPVRV